MVNLSEGSCNGKQYGYIINKLMNLTKGTLGFQCTIQNFLNLILYRNIARKS